MKKMGSDEIADQVEAVIREKIVFLERNSGGGLWRKDLTDVPFKFFSVYSYLIIYPPGTTP